MFYFPIGTDGSDEPKFTTTQFPLANIEAGNIFNRLPQMLVYWLLGIFVLYKVQWTKKES